MIHFQPTSLFTREGDAYVPTVATPGPWSPAVCHGGAVAALMAHLLEEASTPEFESLRFSLDFLRPIPTAPLEARIRPIRQGRRTHLIEGELLVGETLVARGSLLRFRTGDSEMEPRSHHEDAPPADRPEDFAFYDAPRQGNGHRQFMGGGIEVRIPGGDAFVGARMGWFRLLLPVLPGATPSPMVRVAAAADHGSGLGSLARPSEARRITYANADLTIHLSRPAEGQWVRVEAASRWLAGRSGLTNSVISDAGGPLGVAQQIVAIEHIPPPAPGEQRVTVAVRAAAPPWPSTGWTSSSSKATA